MPRAVTHGGRTTNGTHFKIQRLHGFCSVPRLSAPPFLYACDLHTSRTVSQEVVRRNSSEMNCPQSPNPAKSGRGAEELSFSGLREEVLRRMI